MLFAQEKLLVCCLWVVHAICYVLRMYAVLYGCIYIYAVLYIIIK